MQTRTWVTRWSTNNFRSRCSNIQFLILLCLLLDTIDDEESIQHRNWKLFCWLGIEDPFGITVIGGEKQVGLFVFPLLEGILLEGDMNGIESFCRWARRKDSSSIQNIISAIRSFVSYYKKRSATIMGRVFWGRNSYLQYHQDLDKRGVWINNNMAEIMKRLTHIEMLSSEYLRHGLWCQYSQQPPS